MGPSAVAAGGFLHWVSSKSALCLFDVRRAKQPVLLWARAATHLELPTQPRAARKL